MVHPGPRRQLPSGAAFLKPLDTGAMPQKILSAEKAFAMQQCRFGRAVVCRYQIFSDAWKRSVSSASPAGRGESLVTRCCGSVPWTSAGMSGSA